MDLGKNEGGASVSIIQSGKTIATTQTASNGKYTLKGLVNYAQPFDVVFSKPGLVSKKVAFDFSTVNEEDTPASAEFQPLEALDMSLFKDRPEVDFSFLDSEPVAKFDWNQRKMEASLDSGLASRMRSKIEALLNQAETDKAKLEADYQAAIRAGDDAFAKKEYESALSSYESALGFKPNEKYPATKILELDALIKAQKSSELAEKQANQEYYNLIEAADNLAKAGDLEKAITTYQQASSKKSDEQYPKDRITTLQAQIDAKKKETEAQAAYDAAIKSGDNFMKQNSLRPARDKFEEASKLKPSEAYPKQKLKEIEDKMKALEDLEAQKKKYSDAIIAADKLYDAKDYKLAKDKYTEALTFESSSTYAKGRIALCDTELAKSKAEEEQLAKIKSLLEKGNTDLAATKYEDAIKSYNEVITLDKDNVEAKAKLIEAQKKLEDKANAAEQEMQYSKLIAEGDQAVTAKKLEDALAKYEAAKVIKVTPEVNQKITSTQEAINLAKSSAEKETKYNELIADGAKKMAADDLSGALAKYTEAGSVDPTKPEPAKKIAEIQKLMDQRAADEAKNAQFVALMKEGNDLMAAKDLEKAKTKFQEAATIDPKNLEPKAKIKEIDELIAKNSADKAKEEKLQAAISAGDKFFNESKWEDAQAKYREAILIDPTNNYAKDRVSEIDLKIADRKKREQVEVLLATAKTLRDAKKLEDARKKYQEVLTIDPSNAIAATQIDAINSELAALQNEEQKEKAFNDLKAEGFKLAGQKKYPEAKQKLVEALSFKKDTEIEDKIKEIDAQIALDQQKLAKDEQYNVAIKQASESEVSKDYAGAIASYEKAGEIKPEESLPKTKIKELTALLASNNTAQAELDRDYKSAMDRGEKAMTEEKYLDAIKAFNEALALKPTEKLPKDRAAAAEEAERKKGDGDVQYQKLLTVIETKITEADYDKAEELINRAKTFKPDDARPQELLVQVNQLRERDKKYNGLMASAEVLAGKKNYTDAIADFEKAKSVKPIETAPQVRIDEMNRLLKAASSESQMEELYKDYMNKGQAAMTGKKFVEALTHYQNALSVKAGDREAQDKINEIQQILDDLANSDAEKIAKKNKFDALIKEANTLFSQSRYKEAKEQYDLALGVDPFSSYAKERSDECAKIMGNEATNEARAQYDKLIAIADKNFNEENWEKAMEYYNRAKDMLKTDPYPVKKLAEIDAILNPVIVKSEKLEPLGDPFDGTIEDGGFVIMNDAEKRKLSKGTRIKQELDKANYSQSGLDTQNQSDRLDSQNEIYAIWERVSVSTDKSDDSRKARVEQLKESEVQRQTVDINNLAFEKGENLSSQQRLNSVTDVVALDFMESGQKREENVDILHHYQTSQEKETINQGSAHTQKRYEADQALNKVAFKVDEEIRDDYADRLEIERKVNAASDETALVSQSIGEGKYDDVQRQKAGIDLAHANASAKTNVDNEVPGANNEHVKSVKEETNQVALAYMQKNDQHSKVVSAEIEEVRSKVISDNDGFDKVRTEANDRLKIMQSEHASAEDIAKEGETEKYLANKERIDNEEEKRKDVIEQANDAMADKISYVEGQEKSSRAATSQGEQSDEVERLNARKKLENEAIAQSDRSLEDVKSREGNNENLKEVKKTSDSKLNAEGTAQREKNLSTQQDLNKVTTEPKPKVIVANSLGQEYPEGVSQESFTRKDESGLVTTVITRRVVVIDGHADVYVRTQTSQGITYSKNDKPSLQHVWNSETQGPDLVRHY